MKKNEKIIAMVLVAVLAIATIIATCFVIPKDIAPSIDGDVVVETTWPDSQDKQHVEIPVDSEPETKVLLLDKSVSMKDQKLICAGVGYDKIINFSDYLTQENANSQIAKNLILTLDMGVKEVGLVSDLESWPTEDLKCFDGKSYKNREVYIYVTSNATEGNSKKFKEKVTKVLDQKTCTLVVVKGDKKEVIFDNYHPEKKSVSTDIDMVSPKPNISVKDGRKLSPGNYPHWSYLKWILVAFIALCSMLVEALIFQNLNNTEEIVEIPSNVALDSSGSMRRYYRAALQLLNPSHIVWRFNGVCQPMSCFDARRLRPNGCSAGWACLQRMHCENIREVTIISDLVFSDQEVEELRFERIVVIVPREFDFAVLQRLRTKTEELEVYMLEDLV